MLAKNIMNLYWTNVELRTRSVTGVQSNAHKEKTAKKPLTPEKVQHCKGIFVNINYKNNKKNRRT
jgi:hypothetical protein